MEPKKPVTPSCCHEPEATATAHRSIDWLLWIGASIVLVGSVISVFLPDLASSIWWLALLSNSIFEIISKMWIGLVFAVIFVGLLGYIPRDLITQLLGRGGTVNGIFRATLAGVFLDLCSHGILMVGAKLYERGASIGQVMAFLIASPWNSLSLTIVMITLIGLGWTLLFILLSVLIGLISGLIFDALVRRNKLPGNSAESPALEASIPVKTQLFTLIKQASLKPKNIAALL